MTTLPTEGVVRAFLARDRLRPIETLPWIALAVTYFAFPEGLPLGSQIIVMILFAMSMDILAGYTGIVTLGHAAFYGAGAYTVGILSATGRVQDPVAGLIIGGIVSAALGALAGSLMLRTRGLALLILSLALLLMLQQTANQLSSWTGGSDGLQGMTLSAVLGSFSFGFDGRVMFVYASGVLFVCWTLVRILVITPFGRSLVGIRENPTRMAAIGVNVRGREIAAFTISAGLAGIAGGLSAQVDQFVSLNALSFELSGGVLVILVLGGLGRLYGAFIGAPIYLIAQDALAKDNPIYWHFWLGLMLILVVLFAKGGILGLIDAIRMRWCTARGDRT
ncbi:branched-chain amino acid ABC transporter permease [Bradyrhizobium sp. Arg237L]|uniref:branched-chain amino acid ABC transporter permease n=1 Tax=Bradyrhizobium sp. Arg237L TaxID=3003352 RepID=UPI00249D94F2|nr:branched-chain amino acid ABC transporter permease [Bradyrhizobium sp. Arg237L]MDI4237106.1 branched-chain amino acid ABC transporter permease [Bradyrhizobium sp. Arg237L]